MLSYFGPAFSLSIILSLLLPNSLLLPLLMHMPLPQPIIPISVHSLLHSSSNFKCPFLDTLLSLD